MNASPRRWRSVLTLAACVLAAATWSLADRERDRRRKKDRPVRYVVLQIRDCDGTVLFVVEEYDKVGDREKRLKEQFVQAAKDWLAARREARKNNEKFDEPRPRPPAMRRLGRIFRKREDAEEFQRKLEEYWEKKQAEKKKEAEPASRPADDKEPPKKGGKDKAPEQEGRGKDKDAGNGKED